ncbi:MAG: type II secretion system protein GspL [Geobacteraceae bacterium]|nr:type II secretion system protein GspL [Geobacteraceae bacterium]
MNYLIVQLSADEALFARFRKRGRELVFVEGSRHPLDADHSLAALLPEIRAKGKEEERIVLAIPPSLLFMREVELPISERRKAREVLPLEMKGETALDTDELVFDAIPLEGKFLAVWGRKSEIAAEIRGLAGEGMEPEIVTASLFHWHLLLPEKGDPAPVAVTDGEALAVYQNGAPLYFRPLGRGELTAEVARTLAALEIAKGVRVDRVLLHGKAARQAAAGALPEAPEGLSFAILPVAAGLAASFPADPAAALDLAGAYALARALGSEEPVDFRRGELAYTAGMVKARRKLRLSIGLAAAVVVLLCAEVGLRYFLVKRDLASLDNSISTLYREVFPTRKKAVDEVAELRSEIKRLGGPGAASSPLPVLKRLAELKGDDVTGIYEAEIEGGEVRLKGDARSVQGANDFKARAAGVFAGAELGEIKSRPDGSVTFSFRATMKGGEK